MCVELAEEVGLPSFEMYELEVLDEHVHSEVEYLDSIAACPFTQCTGIVGLTCSCWACDDECHGIGDVVAGGKVLFSTANSYFLLRLMIDAQSL